MGLLTGAFGKDSALMGKKGEDPSKKAKKGLKLLPEMEQRQLNQALLMQKLMQGQMGEANVWERAGLMQLMQDERAATKDADAAAKKEAAKVSQGVERAGLSGSLGGVAAKAGSARRAMRGKTRARAEGTRAAINVKSAAMGGRNAARQGMIGIRENIQRVKAQTDLQKLHLTTGNAPVGMGAMLKGPQKGLLGAAAGMAGYAMGGPAGGMIGQSLGDSVGSTFAK